MKKVICIILTLCAVFLMPAAVFAADEKKTEKTAAEPIGEPAVAFAASAYLYNIENAKAVFALNAEEAVYPASTTKLMTGIVAIESLGDRLSETVTVTNEMMSEVAGNNIKLKVGEEVTLSDMLGALLVNGANDAAYVLAYAASGGISEFIHAMNAKAAEIGANNTKYTNPTGMHDEAMVTTAHDTCIIAQYAYNLPKFMDYASLLKYTVPETNMSEQRTVYNRNCLLSLYYEQSYYYDKAVGMNAGSTNEAGYCCVTTASSDGLTYIAVVLDADADEDGTIYSYVDAKAMLEWAFDSFIYLDVLSPEQIVCEQPVSLALGVDYVTLVSSETIRVYLPADTDIETEIALSWTTDTEELQAPITKGGKVGRVTAMYKGEPIGTADLISTVDVARSGWLYVLHRISLFAQSGFFIAVLISAVIFTVIYIFGKAVWLKKKSQRRYRR